MQFKQINSTVAAGLEENILESECIAALKSLGQNKAPVPDGFQVVIILKCWHFMGDDIVKVVKDFNNWGSINWRLKNTFLALIPKKEVVEEEVAFIKGRKILDCALIGNECLDSRIKSDISGVVCKIDFEKTFDHVSWEFVAEVLDKMGFDTPWHKWIQGCISNTPISVLINGSAHSNSLRG
ncbi:uncharacterized protein LOC113280490 [Papaver somniferum]|uniref:uncharacterized protein LOC113280490 n=1 Tax=Papaver somniferum TaxID=3469 RepID=UPI000E6F497C|nr:uncharacterized protein LOC113280490 [Papaver somniferum]